MTSPQQSMVRQNYHAECEAAVNEQINRHFCASYLYLSMYSHFDRAEVALAGFQNFFKKASEEAREDAYRWIKFQNMRGGRVLMRDIAKPPVEDWQSPLDAIQMALDTEKGLNQSLQQIHAVSDKHNNPHMTDFIEDHFLGQKVEKIKLIAEHLANLKRAGPGLGEYMFDKESLEGEH